MKLRYIALAALLAGGAAGAAEDHSHNHDHGGMHQTVATAEATGKVNTVDALKGVLNLSHEPIGAFGWPAMTMDLRLENKALAKGLKPGQKVRFTLKKIGATDYVISAVAPVK